MIGVIPALWRASAYCFHPRVVLWSLPPWLLCCALTFGLAYAHWETAVDGIRAVLDQAALLAPLLAWLDAVGAAGFRAVLAPMVVVALAVPVIVVLTLLLVAAITTPPVVRLVGRRRFASLERQGKVPPWQATLRAAAIGCAALVATAATVPAWFVPPLALVLPALVWGWLVWQVFGRVVLDRHATPDERRHILAARRVPLLVMGLVVGCLLAAPTWLWALGAATLILAPLVMLVCVGLYTAVSAFTALWFAHYLLAALHDRRQGAIAGVDNRAATASRRVLSAPTACPRSAS
jgi:hypothetical protein